MARTVWKYTVAVDDREHTFAMPAGARVLHVACQGSADGVCLWVYVDTSARQVEDRTFCVFGTGHPIDIPDSYVGSALAAGGALVWHVFEVMA